MNGTDIGVFFTLYFFFSLIYSLLCIVCHFKILPNKMFFIYVPGSALMQIVEVYKEIQSQQLNIVSTNKTKLYFIYLLTDTILVLL